MDRVSQPSALVRTLKRVERCTRGERLYGAAWRGAAGHHGVGSIRIRRSPSTSTISFATAAARAALMSIEVADQVAALQGAWRERAGRPRAGSAASRLIALLPALPVLSAPTARAAIGVSQQQTLAALKALAEAGVIRQLSVGIRGGDRRPGAERAANAVGRTRDSSAWRRVPLWQTEGDEAPSYRRKLRRITDLDTHLPDGATT